MERHAVPQNIMEVEFKLFGALTIRQFGYVAAGFIVALLLWFSGWPFLLKFFLILFSVGMGLFLGLVRINGQQSSVWIRNYIIAMFTPQQRVWQKSSTVPEVLQQQQQLPTNERIEHIRKAGKVRTSMSAIPKFSFNQPQQTKVDLQEESKLSLIEQTLSQEFGGNISADVLELQQKVSINEQMQLTGLVVDKDNQPLPNTHINLNTAQGEFVAETATDMQGKFQMSLNIKPGEYIVGITLSGYQFDYYRLKLQPGGSLAYKFSAK